MNALGEHELFAGVPAGLIEHQQDSLGGTCPDGLGELRKGDGEDFCCHGRQQEPLCLARRWMHKTVNYVSSKIITFCGQRED